MPQFANSEELFFVDLGKVTAKQQAHNYNTPAELLFDLGGRWERFYGGQPEVFRKAYLRGAQVASADIFSVANGY